MVISLAKALVHLYRGTCRNRNLAWRVAIKTLLGESTLVDTICRTIAIYVFDRLENRSDFGEALHNTPDDHFMSCSGLVLPIWAEI